MFFILEKMSKKGTIMNITRHAKERYAERVMDKSSNHDIQKFINEHEQKIHDDIEKMIAFGTLIYSGKQTQKDNKSSNIIDVYVNGCWIILFDSANENVITLYKVDLGADEEFNNTYVQKMMERITEAKALYEEVQSGVTTENAEYKVLIEENIAQINLYRNYIKNLEELNAGYKAIIDNNIVKINMANTAVGAVVNKLIGKKEF